MDPRTFDRWTTAFAHRPTRRSALRLLAGGMLAPLLSPRRAWAARQGEGACDPVETLCDGVCVDVLTDPGNCGSCGIACAFDTEVCQSGQCVVMPVDAPCLPGLQWCDGLCVDLLNDAGNCGTCGTFCPADTPVCFNGTCFVPEDAPAPGGQDGCDGGLVLCDGVCVDPLTDPLHCGACEGACAEGTTCQDGTCLTLEGGGCLAGSGLAFCNGLCVDLLNDPLNCGACGGVCAEGTICLQGACVPGSLGCYAGFTDCGGSCVDLLINPFNCGACGVACAEGTVCYGGICTAPRDDICQAGSGLTDCRGFCVDLLSNAFNCGACGHGCVPDTEVCRDGVCATAVVLDCVSGVTCGAICCNFGERCVNGACVVPVTCADGRFDCGGVCCAAGETCVNGACVQTATCAEGDFACGTICCTFGMHICDAGECIAFS